MRKDLDSNRSPAYPMHMTRTLYGLLSLDMVRISPYHNLLCLSNPPKKALATWKTLPPYSHRGQRTETLPPQKRNPNALALSWFLQFVIVLIAISFCVSVYYSLCDLGMKTCFLIFECDVFTCILSFFGVQHSPFCSISFSVFCVLGFHFSLPSLDHVFLEGDAMMPQGQPIGCGSVIRLEHINSGCNLHTHKIPAGLSKKWEVSAFGFRDESGDSGDNFELVSYSKTTFLSPNPPPSYTTIPLTQPRSPQTTRKQPKKKTHTHMGRRRQETVREEK